MARLKNVGSLVPALQPALKAPPKIADRFYHSPEWRRLVAMLKRHRGCFCERCGSDHRVMGDHIRELKDGGAPLDESNVELLCIRCHNSKTHRARHARATTAT